MIREGSFASVRSSRDAVITLMPRAADGFGVAEISKCRNPNHDAAGELRASQEVFVMRTELQQDQDFYSLEDFARRNSIGLSTVYGEIRSGRLAARKIGRRTVIAIDDARAWIDQLPRVQPRTTVDVGSDRGCVDADV
jgi:hypothetical protein